MASNLGVETFVQNEDYSVVVQTMMDKKKQKAHFLHLDVRKYTPSVRKKLQEDLSRLLEHYRNQGATHVFTCTKNDKMTKAFGGEYVRSFDSADGTVSMYVWDTSDGC